MAVEDAAEQLIKSRKRVKDHGEVFTPSWLVQDMCDLVAHECERADSRFLEPACGDGNFLAEILTRKLQRARQKYRKDLAGYETESFVAVTSLYGVDLLQDNVEKCRGRLLKVWEQAYPSKVSSLYSKIRQAIIVVLSRNILCGDALTMCHADGSPLIFTEWSLEDMGASLAMRSYEFKELLEAEDHQGKSACAKAQMEMSFEDAQISIQHETLLQQSREYGIPCYLGLCKIRKFWELTDED